MDFAATLAAADRAALLPRLGGPVRYAPSVGAAVDVTGIFDAAYVQANVGEAGVVSVSPAVFLLEADLPAGWDEDEGATVEVTGVTYRMREPPHRDGMGGALFLLHEA